MPRRACVLFGLLLPFITAGQAPASRSAIDPAEFAKSLAFEADEVGGLPKFWMGGPEGTIHVDGQIAHSGQRAVRLERDAKSDQGFSTITRVLPIDFAGKSLELRGFIRTEAVSGFAGLWMREDGDRPALAFDNMQGRNLKGTTEWAEYSITLPIHADADRLYFGFLMVGTGKAWVDDLQLLVDGKPIQQAPSRPRPLTILDQDHEFDAGSKIALTTLPKAQVDNLALLGKVWGFLKYHHPKITGGEVHWDYALFRIMPNVLSANADVQKTLLKWIRDLGEIKPCQPCATLKETDLVMHPDLGWISDERQLGTELAETLHAIYVNRSPAKKQFFLSKVPNVGNPSFDHEGSHAGIHLPDAGFQLLGLFRFWNIIEYWYPNRDILGEDWNQILRDFIPRIALAKDAKDYQLELMALIAKVHDTHANLWSSLQLRPPVGDCGLPVTVRFAEGVPAVSGYSNPEAGPKTGMKLGDVIEALDGVPVKTLIEKWKPYYAASNEPTVLRDIARSFPRGECVETTVRIRRGRETQELKVRRLPAAEITPRITHDLDGETFRKLSGDVAYLKLSSVKIQEVPKYLDSAAGTKGLIIDIRNYPSEFVVFALGQHFVDRRSDFARFTNADASNPGAFYWTPPVRLEPQKPQYAGKIVILVDEVSQSQAEYTSMAFRAAPHAVVVGSTTAGADGNVSDLPLPGGFRSMISGIGVFYADKRPTQRVGILPDIEVKPSLAGLRAGRDEVLERALREVLGPQTAEAEIQKLARP